MNVLNFNLLIYEWFFTSNSFNCRTMSASNSNNNQFSLRSILDKEKLSGPNFLDWQRNLRNVLMQEQKEYVLDEEMPDAPNEEVTQAALNRWQSANRDVKCIMLATMSPDLQKTFFEKETAFEIISELQNMFQEQARTERFETHRQILESKLKKGEPVSPHVLKMIGLFENMERLDAGYSTEMAIDIILHSLHKGYDQFKMNYNIHSMEKTFTELHGMLKQAEQTHKDEGKHDMLMIKKGKPFTFSSKKKKGFMGKDKKKNLSA